MSDSYPSLPEQSKNLAKFALHFVRKALSEGTNAVAIEGIQRARINTCRACPAYDDIQHRCKECGCYLAVKVKFSEDSCPLGKWKESDEKWASEDYESIIKTFDEKTVHEIHHMEEIIEHPIDKGSESQ